MDRVIDITNLYIAYLQNSPTKKAETILYVSGALKKIKILLKGDYYTIKRAGALQDYVIKDINIFVKTCFNDKLYKNSGDFIKEFGEENGK